MFKQIKYNIFEIQQDIDDFDRIKQSFTNELFKVLDQNDKMLIYQGKVFGSVVRIEFKKISDGKIHYRYTIGTLNGPDEKNNFIGFKTKHGGFNINPIGNLTHILVAINSNIMNFAVKVVNSADYIEWVRKARLYHSNPSRN